MAVIGIYNEPAGRTRVLFDFRTPDGDDESRIADAMTLMPLALPENANSVATQPASRNPASRDAPAFR